MVENAAVSKRGGEINIRAYRDKREEEKVDRNSVSFLSFSPFFFLFFSSVNKRADVMIFTYCQAASSRCHEADNRSE